MIALRRRPRPPEPAAAGTVALAARGLTVRRDGRNVLSDIDLQIRHGEMLLLVGPNGAGKSTLLGTLSGDIRPAEGRVTIAGRPVESWSVRELAMRRAILPQHHTVAFSFTVADIVRMGRAPWVGTPLEEEDEEAVWQAMRDADIDAFADRPFTALSGGEQARAALARVLAQRTATLLLDEPTAALDIRHQELVFSVLTAQAASGRAVVAVVHDLNLAATYADRVAVLSGGVIVACGPPAEVLTAPLLGEVYQHDVEVLPHPRTARPIILPRR